jgi:hypothetical protein
VRLGYDLFEEVAFLLSSGQPAVNSSVPTLELHISLLRKLMIDAGITFIEVPPVPIGYDFAVCLTHDVDFIGIRDHKLDHTVLGFVYRALFRSPIEALKGNLSWSRVLENWKAVLSLPLVHFGIMQDFWLEFDRYYEIEEGASTFFFIPYRNHAGFMASGAAPSRRAAKYCLMDHKHEVKKLRDWGCEIGLHGIDAWRNPIAANAELSHIRELTGQQPVGVRMHWLYFSETSPLALEQGGASYDSTCGYNEAVGFRAGTAQVFQLPNVELLLELPLSIQDTALFYPDRLSFTEGEAFEACKEVIGSVSEFGGVLTINWHTRSLSPERLWGSFYKRLLAYIKTHRVWFATGQEITEWFKARRSLRFDSAHDGEDSARVILSNLAMVPTLPFAIRVHLPDGQSGPMYCDAKWSGETNLEIPFPSPV